jgi:hypothetical protein
MTTQRLRCSQDWSGGLLKALALPDGAFKLYVWLRLHARIDTGSIEIGQLELARVLNKAPGTIRANLKILVSANVCQVNFGHNPHAPGWIQIMDDYWPYVRADSPTEEDPELRAYLDRIQELLGERACVRSPLSAADDLLAREWHARGVSLERIGQAVLMGCGRKYVSWRNGAPRVPIGSLRYFEAVLAELAKQPAPPPEYWDYTRQKIERMEKLWRTDQRSEDPTVGGGGGDPSEFKHHNGGLR